MTKKASKGPPVFRDIQYDFLKTLLQPDLCPPLIHCSGVSSTGKTLTIRALLTDLQIRFAWFECVQSCHQPRILFEDVMVSLRRFGSGKQSSRDYLRCENPNDFVHSLKELVEERKWTGEPVVIVLKGTEHLRPIPSTLTLLTRLREFVGFQVTVISVSSVPIFRPSPNLLWRLNFPNYTEKELKALLCLDAPNNFHKDVYERFVAHVYAVVHQLCHNISELRYLTKKLWPDYIDPVVRGEVGEGDSKCLWAKVRDELGLVVKALFLRTTVSQSVIETENSQPLDILADAIENVNLQSSQKRPSTSTVREPVRTNQPDVPKGHPHHTAPPLHLPKQLKYLLIAAYCASYNPPTSDKRFFSKGGGSKRRQWIAPQLSDKNSAHFKGPKAFGLERLLNIFSFISEEDDALCTASCSLGQISTLVSAGLLAQISATGNLELPKFKCIATLELTRAVASSVDFELLGYLLDFTHV